MPDTEQPARPPAAARPSLMGATDTPTRASATTDAGRMRMLDELEAVVRPRVVERSAAPSNWLIALLAFGVVLGGLLWWTKHRTADTSTATPVAAAPAKETAALAPTPPAASAPAVIESVAAATPPATVPDAAVADGAASPSASTVAAPPLVMAAAPAVARAVTRPVPAPAKPVKAQANDAKVTTVTTASGGKWTVTVADASIPASTVAADKPLPSPASAVAAPVPARTATASKGDDADVRLLSALLAHVSRPAPGTPLADEDQLTIAQVVKRCDARPAAEVRECRRRICEGYWGKAEACPVAAAKKG